MRRNEWGLYVHSGAARVIEAYERSSLQGRYPLYLMGMTLPGHRNGPANVVILALPDGGVVGAHATSRPSPDSRRFGEGQLTWRGRRIVRARFRETNYDIGACDDDERLLAHRALFYEDLGGFGSAGFGESSPTLIAERMLIERSELAASMCEEVLATPPDRFPSDWSDMAVHTDKAIGRVVEGYRPPTELLERLDLPAVLKRQLQLAESPELEWLRRLQKSNPDLPASAAEYVQEAWEISHLSPKGAVVLLRSAAEVVIEALLDEHPRKRRFVDKIARLEQQWEHEISLSGAAARRAAAMRARKLAALDTMRELGNLVHGSEAPTPEQVRQAQANMQELLTVSYGTINL